MPRAHARARVWGLLSAFTQLTQLTQLSSFLTWENDSGYGARTPARPQLRPQLSWGQEAYQPDQQEAGAVSAGCPGIRNAALPPAISRRRSVLSPGKAACRFLANISGVGMFRPSPPPQALDWLIPPSAQAVLDLAAGTGAVTRELVGRAPRVIAVEPDERMRAVLTARCPDSSRSRLVASTRISSQAASSPAHSSAAAPITCSQLSGSSCCCRASTSATGTPGCSRTPAPPPPLPRPAPHR